MQGSDEARELQPGRTGRCSRMKGRRRFGCEAPAHKAEGEEKNLED